MGIYLGANALGGGSGGGGAALGDLVPINQDGTSTDDPTTNFIIERDGAKYLRTGITINDFQNDLPYEENVLPYVYEGALDSQKIVGGVVGITSLPNALRSSLEVTGSPQLIADNNAYAQLWAFFHKDDTHSFIYRTANVSTSTKHLLKVDNSTGAMQEFAFPFGATGLGALSSSARFKFTVGKGLFANKILLQYGNSSTESGFIVLNKDCAIDTSFNHGLFSGGKWVVTGSGSSNPMYYGIALNTNSRYWQGWMKVHPDNWARSAGAAHVNGSTSGNASIPSSDEFELRYVTITGYIYPGGHYYTALDHATASVRSGIGLADAQLAMKWELRGGSAAPNTLYWDPSITSVDTPTPVSNNYPMWSFGDIYDTAAEAQAALDTLNTANGTSYNSFSWTAISQYSYGGIWTAESNGDISTSFAYAISTFEKLQNADIVGEELSVKGTRYNGVGVANPSSSDADGYSFYYLVRIVDYQTAANPGTNVTKHFLIEMPATVSSINAMDKKVTQGYIRPMYYDIRDDSISYGTGSVSQRTTGPHTDQHHDNLVSGDTRSKFIWPLWVRVE